MSPPASFSLSHLMYQIGSIYENNQIFAKAKEYFERVILSANDQMLIGGVHFHLGRIYKALGEEKRLKGNLKSA